MDIKKLYEKYKDIIPYAVFGVLTTLVNIAVYWLMAHPLGLGVMPSTIIAWIAAVLFAYITNRKWVFHSEANTRNEIIKEMTKRGEEVPTDAFGHPRLDKVNVGQYVGKRFGQLLGAEKVQVFKSGYFARAAAPCKKDLKLIEKCARKAVACALAGESGVVGPDERKGAKICACEFPSIKGGKPFNVRKGSFRKMLSEIGQPKPRKKRTAK